MIRVLSGKFRGVIAGLLLVFGFPETSGAQAKYVVTREPDDPPNLVRVNGTLAHATRFLAQEAPRPANSPPSAIPSGPQPSVVHRMRRDPSVVVLDTQSLLSQPGSTGTPTSLVQHFQTQFTTLQRSGNYRYVEPDYLLEASAVPTDQFFTEGRLWGLQNVGQDGGTAGVDINAVPAWDITTGSPGVVVAVIDSGIRYTHQDLVPNLWQNTNEIAGNNVDDDNNGFIDDIFGINAINGSGDPMDDNGHGTLVSGVIGAVGNGSGPHVGVAWNVRLMGLKFLGSNGTGFTSHAAACVEYAVNNGAHIINGSFGGTSFSTTLSNEITTAQQAGVLFVAAAGNDAVNIDQSPRFPAAFTHANILTVAAIDRNDQLASFSNFGTTGVDIAAPGVNIVTTGFDSDQTYRFSNGTSLAAPFVAGVAALIKAQFPTSNAQEMKARILQSAVATTPLNGRIATGGRMDALGALNSGADNDLEFAIALSPTTPVAGRTANVFVTLTDLLPVPGATVDAVFEVAGGGQSQALTTTPLIDTGVAPDATAGDAIYSGTLAVPAGITSATLRITAQAAGKNPGNTSQAVTFTLPPANDDFENRIPLTLGTLQSTGNNQNALTQTGEPNHPSTATVGATLWWQWLAQSTAPVILDTVGSNFDTTLAVYRGAALTQLQIVASNDDITGSTQSRVHFLAEAGAIYAIQVGGFNGAQGSVVLNHPLVETPSGHARIITPPGPAQPLRDHPTTLFAELTGAAPVTVQWFKDGTPIPNATDTAYQIASTTVADEGQYWLEIQNALGSESSLPVTVQTTAVGSPPPNDAFTQATALNGQRGTVTGSNAAATAETGEPNHANASSPNPSVWYQWTAPTHGILRLDTFGSNFNTTLAAYTGSSVASLTEIASNNDATTVGTNFQQSAVNFPVSEGTAYSIAISGSQGASGNIQLHFALNVQEPNPVLNGSFESGTLAGWTLTDLALPTQAAGITLRGQLIEPLLPSGNSLPSDGFHSFTHGFAGNPAGTITLSQEVALPTESLFLSLTYRAGWTVSGANPPTQPRTFSARVTPNDGGADLLDTVILNTGLTAQADTGLQTVLLPINNTAGQNGTLRLIWSIPEANPGVGFFELDAVQIISGCSVLPGLTFTVASDISNLNTGDHFHSVPDLDVPSVAEVGRFAAEAVQGHAEFNLAGNQIARLATLQFQVLRAGGEFNGVNDSPFQGTIAIEAYTPASPTTPALTAFQSATRSTIGNFATATLSAGSTLEFDITNLYNQEIAAARTSLGIRLRANPLPAAGSGAWTFHQFSLVVDNRVLFTDSTLEQAVRTAHSLPAGLIKIHQLQSLTTLDLANLGITSLAGLEHATALTSLNLIGNNVIDLSPIASLATLQDGATPGLRLENNLLEIGPGSTQRLLIDAFAQQPGLTVTFRPQRIIDTDGDNLDDRFEQRIIDHDPNDAIQTLADVSPTDDFDNDTASNLAEFLRNTLATDENSVGRAGDIDGDGAVTLLDLVRILDHLRNVGTSIAADRTAYADTNLDNQIDLTDRQAIEATILQPTSP